MRGRHESKYALIEKLRNKQRLRRLLGKFRKQRSILRIKIIYS